jgi:GGDEF domain-containing protein
VGYNRHLFASRARGVTSQEIRLLTAALRALLTFALPCLVLLAVYAARLRWPLLPPALHPLVPLAVYGALGAAALAGAAFNRGRAALAAAVLALAYLGHRVLVAPDPGSAGAVAAWAAICVLVPVNLLAQATLAERGLFNGYGLRRLLALALQAGFVAWLAGGGSPRIVEWLTEPLVQHPLLAGSAVPQPGLAAIVLSLAAALILALRSQAPMHAALAGAIAAFGAGAWTLGQPHAVPVWIACAAVILAAGVLHDSYRMAFRDELTGLANRRALNERLMSLGNQYAIAMVDVDHFKKFNDTHGHDVGDQVLRMVATRIAAVGGGGRPFRYGGEEFTVLFPGRGARDALPWLEALRESVEAYTLALRGRDRPASPRDGKDRRGAGSRARAVSVTVSIGVAERSEKYPTPEDVIQAADRALYRAKNRGRNQVSR